MCVCCVCVCVRLYPNLTHLWNSNDGCKSSWPRTQVAALASRLPIRTEQCLISSWYRLYNVWEPRSLIAASHVRQSSGNLIYELSIPTPRWDGKVAITLRPRHVGRLPRRRRRGVASRRRAGLGNSILTDRLRFNLKIFLLICGVSWFIKMKDFNAKKLLGWFEKLVQHRKGYFSMWKIPSEKFIFSFVVIIVLENCP